MTLKKSMLFFLLLTALTVSTAGAAPEELVEMKNEDRLTTRAWAQWWLASTTRPSRLQALASADLSYDRGDLNIARDRYLVMAAHGDKFAQYRLGMIDIKRKDKVSAWAWFTLANESGREPAFAFYPPMVWRGLNETQQQAAQARLEERIKKYSDYGLAERLHRLFRQRLRSTTGSRLGYVGNLLANNGGSDGTNMSSITAASFYDGLKEGLEATGRLLDNYGTVTLGDLDVLEEGEPGAE